MALPLIAALMPDVRVWVGEVDEDDEVVVVGSVGSVVSLEEEEEVGLLPPPPSELCASGDRECNAVSERVSGWCGEE